LSGKQSWPEKFRFPDATIGPISRIDNGHPIKYFGCFLVARWQWILLISELFQFALILVLPQVGLPDTTFQEGGAPVIARALLNPPPPAPVSLIDPPVRSLGNSGRILGGPFCTRRP
jgi:hypothetical protein